MSSLLGLDILPFLNVHLGSLFLIIHPSSPKIPSAVYSTTFVKTLLYVLLVPSPLTLSPDDPAPA